MTQGLFSYREKRIKRAKQIEEGNEERLMVIDNCKRVRKPKPNNQGREESGVVERPYLGDLEERGIH